MTHRIHTTDEAFWSPGNRMAVSVVQAYPPRGRGFPLRFLAFIGLAALLGVALIMVPALIEARIHHG